MLLKLLGGRAPGLDEIRRPHLFLCFSSPGWHRGGGGSSLDYRRGKLVFLARTGKLLSVFSLSLYHGWQTGDAGICHLVRLIAGVTLSLPERMLVHFNEQKVSSLSAAAVMADKYALTHKVVFPACVTLEWSGRVSVPPSFGSGGCCPSLFLLPKK